MVWLDILVFCRITTGLLFLISSTGKLLNVSQFQQTITLYRIFPRQMSSLVSWGVITAEIAVVLLLAIGDRLLLIGFFLASALLFIFCTVLISVLVRSIQAPCNCFGDNKQPVTWIDISRNVVFLLYAVTGFTLLTRGIYAAGQLDLITWLLSGIMAVICVMMLISLNEIIYLFH